ncbi:hypothetical protein JOQ06_019672 [Pogonophryne albipinna]|uniref:Eukaryotic translation initiation factor 2-alpha kinase 2 n=1 Tax=Pogonophryne albipinna TaxID=1090488 RepID=A0AAD6BQ77_9TELE|nr:hypothetical protein JOQ06_019672 [Pogonophryne albipinna]
MDVAKLNEYAQRERLSLRYEDVGSVGPDHIKTFTVRAFVNGNVYPDGVGNNKKEAKQNAATHALRGLLEKPPDPASLCSAASDDGALARMSTPPSPPEFLNPKHKSLPKTSTDSAVFSNSSNLAEDKIQSPDVKPKIRIAANFKNSPRSSKDDVINFNDKKTGSSPSKETTKQSVNSRFTSEFDSIVRLGSGSFGRVYKAQQKLLMKDYAIKIVPCKEIKKVLREVTALSDLQHSNIVRYYTCWLEDSGYQWDSKDDRGSSSQSTGHSSVKFFYIQMELCDTTLRVWIDQKNVQNVKKSLRDSKRREEGLTIAQQIVSGVEYIHSKMLIHRDLKPANIMFGQNREAKIGDFGLVTDENDDDADNLMERTVYKGTPGYMAPEQKNMRTSYDRKVDIFALGLIFFEVFWKILLDERKPIWDDARDQTLPQGFQQHFPLECKIIMSMLCEKPQHRPEASKLKTAVEECTRRFTYLKDMCLNSQTF